MKIIQIGAAKSGNFWLYKIIQEIYLEAEIQRQSFIQNQPIYEVAQNWDLSYQEQAGIDVIDIENSGCSYRIGSIFKMPILDLDQYISKTNHVWTHSAFCSLSKNVLSKFDKIIYLIRDPRDRAISAAKFRFSDYGKRYYSPSQPDPATWMSARYDKLIRRWVQHVGRYLLLKYDLDLHIVFYERLLSDFNQELDSLLQYLGLSLEQESLLRIKEAVDFNTMKKNNPGHVRKGKHGNWRDVLNTRQKWITRINAGNMLKLLNYSINNQKSGLSLPNTPNQKQRKLILRALKRADLLDNISRIQRFVARI